MKETIINRSSSTLAKIKCSLQLFILLGTSCWGVPPATAWQQSRRTPPLRLPSTYLSSYNARSPIAVAIDEPVIPSTLFTTKVGRSFRPMQWIQSMTSTIGSSLAGVNTQTIQLAVAAFLVAFVVSISLRNKESIVETVSRYVRFTIGRVQRTLERMSAPDQGIPMPFDEQGSDGWGVCTLKSKKRYGQTNFVQYDFELPHADYVLPLELGQQISLMCLDTDANVAKGDFYQFSPTLMQKKGEFSVLVPNRSHESNVRAVGLDAANLVRVMNQEMRVGDEIALKPGPSKLRYRGQFLPVTDMVYVACGTGIVPVLEQSRAVLADLDSSVDSVSVIWINEDTKDFDQTADLLEKEYYKYSNKLAVACIVDKFRKKDLSENVELNEAVPVYKPGTMAVLAGPSDVTKQAIRFLEERGYSKDVICVL